MSELAIALENLTTGDPLTLEQLNLIRIYLDHLEQSQ